MCVNMYTVPVKSIWPLSENFISHLKSVIFNEKVKHHNGFIYTKYKSSWATLNTN